MRSRRGRTGFRFTLVFSAAAVLVALLAVPAVANAQPAGWISGRVTDSAGNGIPYVNVSTVNATDWRDSCYASTSTDTQGYYSVLVETGHPSLLYVMFNPDYTNGRRYTNYIGEFYGDTQQMTMATPVACNATNVDAQLAVGTSISGKVYLSDGVAFGEGMDVEWRVGTDLGPRTRTGADGSYLLRGVQWGTGAAVADPTDYNYVRGTTYTQGELSLAVTSNDPIWVADIVLGKTSVYSPPPASILKPVWRFYRPSTGTHFYTRDEEEMARVRDTMKATYDYEGICYYFNTANPANCIPLYRYFNPRSGTHFYTADVREMAAIPYFYQLEGVAYNISITTGTQVHRFYSPSKGVHFYSASSDEVAWVRANLVGKWDYEGPAYFVGQ